jgi:polysaccharide biosynthesis protein PslH
MRLLVVYPYVPYPPDRGTFQRTYHLLRALAKDHEVDLLALCENGEREDQKPHFEGFCRRVEFVRFAHPPWPRLFPDRLLNPLPTTIRHWRLPHIAEALKRFIGTETYPLVHVCDIVMAQYFLENHQHVPLAIDRSRVDLQFQLAQRAALSRGFRQSLLDWENLAKLKRFEQRIARRTALEVVCGPDDENFIRLEISGQVRTLVITNGVDLDYFTPESTPMPRAVEPTVLFCGAMDYSPNVDALRWFFEEIHAGLLEAVPQLRVLIVGKAPLPEVQAYASRTGVTVTGGVPDVRPYYRQAWLQIVPLRIGGGTRLKIPESMAMGTPVVSTTIGAQGLELRHGEEILLADTARSFIEETAKGLRDGPLRHSLEVTGQQTVRDRLSWKTLGRQLSETYERRFAS